MYDADLLWTYKSELSRVNSNQLVNWVEGRDQIDNKDTLIKTLRTFDGSINQGNGRYKFNSSYFIPQSYLLDYTKSRALTKEEKVFINLPDAGVWISKPVKMMCGIGIEMVYNTRKLKKQLIRDKERGYF